MGAMLTAEERPSRAHSRARTCGAISPIVGLFIPFMTLVPVRPGIQAHWTTTYAEWFSIAVASISPLLIGTGVALLILGKMRDAVLLNDGFDKAVWLVATIGAHLGCVAVVGFIAFAMEFALGALLLLPAN